MNQRKSAATYVATLAVLLACMVLGGVAATGDTPLTAPTGLTAADGTTFGQANLAWNAVPGATHYRVGWIAESDVDRTPGADWLNNFNFVDRAGPANNYTVENLAQGEKYWFIVGALQERFGSTGDAWSDWTNVTTAQDTGSSSPMDCIAAGTCLPIQATGTFTGTGDSADDIIRLVAGVYRFTSSRQNTDGNFFISVVELASGDDRLVGIYGRGTGRGAQTLTIYDDDSSFRLQAGNYVLEVDTESDWDVIVELLAAH